MLQYSRNIKYGGKKYDRSGAQNKDNGNTYLEQGSGERYETRRGIRSDEADNSTDIALLRAEGKPVGAERRGYYLKKAEGIYQTVICRHDVKGAAEEFNAIVDNGGKVLNVIVEHPLYGNISAELNVTSRYDAEEFVRKTEESNASFLSDLTGGLHIHTISVPDEKSYERIVTKLRALDILAEEGSVGE